MHSTQNLPNIEQAISKFGKSKISDFLVQLIKNPNIDGIISFLALTIFIQLNGTEGLKYFSEFPRCFLGKRTNAHFGEKSIIEALVEMSEEDEISLYMLIAFVDMFKEPSFWATIYSTIQKLKLKSPTSKLIKKYLVGKTSIHNLRKLNPYSSSK